MQRHILHIDNDTFFVSVARKQNSGLIGKPVLIGGSSDRGVVAACSYETRVFGVHSAMPMKLALQLCPQAILVRGDYDSYSEESRVITQILEDKAPKVEKASIDEYYLDLTGMDKHFGCNKWSLELREYIMKETGLPLSCGLSENKTVSKIATGQAKPCGHIHVDYGQEKPFLAPLSSRKIPMIGAKTFQTLKNMGLEKIKTIQEMPIEPLHDALGENGVSIWHKANGIDNSLVIPYSEQKSMSKRETFEKDTIDMDRLRKVLIKMVDDLSFELRKQQKLTGCISVTIRYSNFDTEQKQAKIPYTALDTLITPKVLDLFQKLYSRRMLIRLIGVKFSDIIGGSYQIDLFNDVEKDINLHRALDGIRNRFGTDKVMRAILAGNAYKRT
jgi:DNA polymerase IV